MPKKIFSMFVEVSFWFEFYKCPIAEILIDVFAVNRQRILLLLALILQVDED